MLGWAGIQCFSQLDDSRTGFPPPEAAAGAIKLQRAPDVGLGMLQEKGPAEIKAWFLLIPVFAALAPPKSGIISTASPHAGTARARQPGINLL